MITLRMYFPAASDNTPPRFHIPVVSLATEPRASQSPTPSLTCWRGWEKPCAVGNCPRMGIVTGLEPTPSCCLVDHHILTHCTISTPVHCLLFHPPLHLHIGPLPLSFKAKWNVVQDQGLTSGRAILGPDKINAMTIITRCPAPLRLHVHHPAWPADPVSRFPQQALQTLPFTHRFPRAQDLQFAHGAHHTSDHRLCQVLDMNAPI